jgi:hypothetical protein
MLTAGGLELVGGDGGAVSSQPLILSPLQASGKL